MHKRGAPYLVFGILITSVASCRSAANPSGPTVEPSWEETAPLTTSSTPAVTAKATAEPPRPPPLPTGDDWQTLGSDRAGLSLAVPPTWINLTDQINIPVMDNRLGINLLFAADSERAGRSLLAGKAFDAGAYVSGLVVTPPTPLADPATALVELLNAAAPSAVRLTPITPIVSTNGVEGFAVDVGDGPIGLNVAEPNNLRTRVALFAPPSGGSGEPVWIALLLSASAGVWEQQVSLFDRMLQSARVFDVRPGAAAQEGNVVVRGELVGDEATTTATLERGVNDLWTFVITGNRYASIFLRPEDAQLDLTLTLLGPERQTIARVENGYAGASESVADLLLTQPGVYIVEVGDFYRNAGRYTLSLGLAGQPQYRGGGPIAFGQALQGELPAGGQHYWVFSGATRQRVSIVVEPGAPAVDAVVELYAPDGRQLIALDEGFSGDPEVLSNFELPAAGEYAILVRSFSPQGGPYTISLDEGGQSIANFYDAGDLVYGEVRQEMLERQEAHTWFLQGRTGDHILVRVTPLSGALDLDVWLLDGNVERVAAVDSFAAGEPETIELTLSADGQYIVLVRDFNGEPGEYEIALGAAPAATPVHAGALSVGDSIIGVIDPGAAVAWTFDAGLGDVINVEAQPGDSAGDILLQLVGPDGRMAVEVDAESAGGSEAIRAFVVPATGQWRVLVREFFGDATSYRLSLRRAQ
jgi:hypothetical protein